MKLKQIFESQFPTSKEEVEAVLKLYKIKNYTINDNLTVDVDGDVGIYNSHLRSLPVKFGNVDGHFDCASNELTSLEGAPIAVGGSFYCNDNHLTSLIGAPREVGGDFYCSYNRLSSLDGIGNVGGEIYSGLS